MDNSDLSTDLYSLVQSTYNLPVMSTLELVRTAGQSLVDCLQCAEDQSDSDSCSSGDSSEGCVGDKNGVQRAYKGIYCMYCMYVWYCLLVPSLITSDICIYFDIFIHCYKPYTFIYTYIFY